jgi:hypothetical protein
MRNQRGEVVTGVMVVIMCVMMLSGGMHIDAWGLRSEGDHRQMEQKAITMRTACNTCITMLKGKIPSPVRMEPSK